MHFKKLYYIFISMINITYNICLVIYKDRYLDYYFMR